MSRRTNRAQTPPVSLFPFLAVLICTMGILIVLLVMAVKSSQDQASAKSAEQQADTQAQLARKQAELDARESLLEGIREQRPGVQQRLQREQNRRGYLELEIQELKQRLQVARQQQDDLNKQAPAAPQTIEPERAEALKSQIHFVSTQLESARQAAENRPTRYSIVPHQSRNGTSRRPIYVECTSSGLVLQPSGIVLTSKDFTVPVLPGNPFDAALVAVREYWNRYHVAGELGQPYPLLVVRPSGTGSFAVARRAMMSWVDEFGYELVEADKELDYGDAEPELTRMLRQAIADARARQTQMAHLLRAQGRQVASLADVDTKQEMSRRGRGAGGSSANGSAKLGHENPAAEESGFASSARSAQALSNSSEFSVGAESGTGGSDPSTERAERSLDPNSSEKFASSQHRRKAEGVSWRPTSGSEDPPTRREGNPSGQPGTSSGNSGGQGNAPGGASSADADPIASDRGQQWALPSRTPGAVAYRRPVKIICEPHQLTIEPGRFSTIARTTVATSPLMRDAVDPLVSQIWELIDSWGIAGTGGYWKPVLNVHVAPGAERQFVELRQLLMHSGLDIERARP